MGSARIKKKSADSTSASMMPRQGAIPCLILIALIVLGLSLLGFFALKSAG
jgi:hypothetical protein